MQDNPFINLKVTRGEARQLLKVLHSYRGEKPRSCSWMIKILNQQLEANGINPTKLTRN
jgi:hypothetical protein